jgi:hypothetical protein
MLGIDITLLSLESIPSRDQNVCTLAIEFLDLQPVYITVNNKPSCVRSSSSSSGRKNPSISQANFGKGSFSIIEGTEELLDRLKSPVHVKVSLLTKNDQLLLYEYGCGKIENLSFSSESSTENNSQPLNSGTNAVNEYEEIFQQKLKVFGEASIVAFCPSAQFDLVHSFGVSSSAGSATIAIAIIDLMKATSSRTIGATGRIIHDVPNDAEVRPIGIPFDVKGFLNQADRGVVPIPVPAPLLGDGIRNLVKRSPCETSFDFSVEGYLDASMDSTIALALRVQYQGQGQDEVKDEDHGDSEYNSDDSVSIDDFFDKIHRKKALQESKLFLSETLDRDEESFEVKDPSTFHYKTVQRPKPKQKVTTYGDRRKPVLVGYKAGRVPPRAVTQNGVPVSAARRVVKEWDSSPLNREVIVRKEGPVKPSKSKKQSSGLTAERERGKGKEKEKDRGERSVSVSDTSSMASSSSVSAPNAVDWQLRHAAERAVLTSRYTVVRPGAEAEAGAGAGGRAESGGVSGEAPVPTAVPTAVPPAE